MFPESKFTDILSQRWKWHSMSVAVSERTLPFNLFHWPIQTPSHWWIPLDTLWAYRRAPLCLPFCTVMLMSVSLNTSFHTFCLVWLYNNPSLLFVWKEAKIWYMSGSLHLDCCLFPFHVITSPMNGALLHLNSNFSFFNLICFAQLQSHSIRTENCVRLTYQ